ncbi:MAG: hypothetical protein KBC64_02185 [Simkaniaceae bacterium]|nr:hypothetical protein [Simkaniaceae bacterium]
MSISPISPTGIPEDSRKASSPVLDQFAKDWNAWYNSPSKETGNTLLHFLENHKETFIEEGSHLPCPFGPNYTESFEKTITNAIHMLKGWVENPLPNLTPVSELIANVYDWLHQ